VQPNQTVIAGHSRPKDGVLSHAYVPAIPLRRAQCLPKGDGRHKAGHDESLLSHLLRAAASG